MGDRFTFRLAMTSFNYQTPGRASSSHEARDSRGPDYDRPDPWTSARDGYRANAEVQVEREAAWCAPSQEQCVRSVYGQEYRESLVRRNVTRRRRDPYIPSHRQSFHDAPFPKTD